jgi:hypothetical protein
LQPSTASKYKSSKYQTSASGKQQSGSIKNGVAQAKVYVFDISNLINIRREFAERYHVNGNLERTCEHNMAIAIQDKRPDIVKVNIKSMSRISLQSRKC